MQKELLRTLHEEQVFQVLLRELEQSRPIVPRYDHKSDNYREVCSNMLIQQGFDRAMAIINPFKEPK